jgi:hypothetical protein
VLRNFIVAEKLGVSYKSENIFLVHKSKKQLSEILFNNIKSKEN